MNYTEFKNNFRHLPLISSRDVVRLKEDKQAIRNQLNRWLKRGLIIALKRGVYLLNENDRGVNPGRAFIANQLYAPSYVSLEYALNFYGLIPEMVYDVTSVTTRKTLRLKNKLGNFIYQHIKPESFRGFKAVKEDSGLSFFIAEPEKAVVDFLYLNLGRIKANDKTVFEISYRFQNVEGLSKSKITAYTALFKNAKLKKVASRFCGFLKLERQRK